MNKIWGFVQKDRHGFGGGFGLCLCFIVRHSHIILKLESRALVTLVFGFEKSPRIHKSWKYVHGFVLGVHGLVLGESVFIWFSCIVLWF